MAVSGLKVAVKGSKRLKCGHRKSPLKSGPKCEKTIVQNMQFWRIVRVTPTSAPAGIGPGLHWPEANALTTTL